MSITKYRMPFRSDITFNVSFILLSRNTGTEFHVQWASEVECDVKLINMGYAYVN